MKRRARVVLADAHPIVLDALDRLFGAAPDFRVAARCATTAATLAAVREHGPDLVIVEPTLPGADGSSILQLLRREKSKAHLVLFAAALGDDEALDALRLGVRGMVLKEQDPQQLLQCARKVLAGGHWIEKNAASQALEMLLRREAGVRELRTVLTPRELELVRMVCDGLSNEAAAERLAISRGTVKVHLHHIYRKLKIRGRVELILYAQRYQLAARTTTTPPSLAAPARPRRRLTPPPVSH